MNTEVIEKQWISGFWRRIGALILDTIVLAVVGAVLGWAFSGVFVGMGAWGRSVGFVVSIGYFGVMNSVLFNGQTIGKRILGIRVVDKQNNPISLVKSMARYVVYGLPFVFNGAELSSELESSFVVYLLSFIVFGLGISVIYMYIFNRHNRQSLHDVVMGTYVVNADATAHQPRETWKVHYFVVGAFFILSLIVPKVVENLAQNETFSPLVEAQQRLMERDDIKYAAIADNVSVNTSDVTTTSIIITANLFINDVDNEELAKSLATDILISMDVASERNFISVTLLHGYDIYIWSFNHQQAYQFTPSDLVADVSAGSKKTM